ncbi:hypothetical protein PABG_12263 [Paracoccidioides brasiliensis Pb03]|nr:hypothetical protein PABG_12263 [Paracoccidioides brasiliensis Pb03]
MINGHSKVESSFPRDDAPCKGQGGDIFAAQESGGNEPAWPLERTSHAGAKRPNTRHAMAQDGWLYVVSSRQTKARMGNMASFQQARGGSNDGSH